MNTGKYLFENSVMEIVDEELNIHLKVPCTPKLLPEKAIDGMSLSDGHSVRQVFSESEDPKLLIAYICKGEKPSGQYCEFHENGAIKNNCYYSLDESKSPISFLHGPSIHYSPDSNVLSQSWYCKGKLQGKVRSFYLSGKNYSIRRYRDGVLQGKQEYFFEDGEFKTELFYTEGHLHGICSLYHNNGRLFRKISYKDGKKDGVEEGWSPSGLKSHYKLFAKDVLLEEKMWNHRRVLLEERQYLGPPEKFSFRNWSKSGLIEEEGQYVGGCFHYKQWNEDRKVIKEYYGHWDGEKVAIDKYTKGSITPDDAAALTEEAVHDLADRQKKYNEKEAADDKKKETTQDEVDSLKKEEDRNQ
ncbi:MAG: antitoxin component YwqK of YwqJK toxin-antitoxin module [Chlamydiales bacterium]|jgi:antitoxin component YwqK of YwqJK toxin-antitoxin module